MCPRVRFLAEGGALASTVDIGLLVPSAKRTWIRFSIDAIEDALENAPDERRNINRVMKKL